MHEEVVTVEPADDDREDKPAETIQKEDVTALTKQDSSSQSILALLVRPQPTSEGENRKLNPEKQNVEMCADLPENLADRGGIAIDNDPRPSNDRVVVLTPPENFLLAENGGGAPSEESGRVELQKEQLSTPEKDFPTRTSTKPRPPVAIFSETSSESAAGGFHFSVPREPLRPLISTTPPPIRPVRHDTPDSEERGGRLSIIPDVVAPVVTETPGMSSQGMF